MAEDENEQTAVPEAAAAVAGDAITDAAQAGSDGAAEAPETPGAVDVPLPAPEPKRTRSRTTRPKAAPGEAVTGLDAGSEPAAGPEASAEAEVADEGPSARAPRGARAKKAPAPTRAKTKAERGVYVRTPAAPAEQGPRKERRGVVTSDKGEKSITVRVDEMKRHRKYKKIMRRSIKLNAHDERNEAKIGDVVRIVETRPLSRTKRWRLVEIVEVAK